MSARRGGVVVLVRCAGALWYAATLRTVEGGDEACLGPNPARHTCTTGCDFPSCAEVNVRCDVCVPDACDCDPGTGRWNCLPSCGAVCLPRSIDDDSDTDLMDFAIFQRCFRLDYSQPTPPECIEADHELDRDVDLNNFCVLTLEFTGPQ